MSGSLLRDLPGGTAKMLDVWNDAALLRAALQFEVALAQAQAEVGLIEAAHAATLEMVAARFAPDLAQLAAEAAHAGTLAIPLVAALRAEVAACDPAAAASVHRGATSQDLADTAMVLHARAGLGLVLEDLARIEAALADRAREHAATPLLGRTLLQAARPVSLGLKLAQWSLAARDAAERLRAEAACALVLQLGGAAGTLDGMGGQGAAISAGVAARLGLPAPALPWHARRGNLAGLGAACAIAAGEAAKMAQDIALLAQGEVGEAREPASPGRGSSSAMPHKQNQTLCQRALTAHARAAGLAGVLLGGLAQEQERGLGGWQAEGPVLAELFCATHAAVAAMAETAEGLAIDTAAMARNLRAAGVGEDIGEARRLTFAALAQGEDGTCPSR